MQNRKITFIIDSLGRGGAQKVISILSSECASMGYEASLILLNNIERTYKVFDKVKCYQIDADEKAYKEILRIKQMRKYIRQINPDIIVPFLPSISLYALIAGLGIKKKIVMSERNDPNINLKDKKISKKNKILHILMRKLELFSLADHMVFQTPDAQAFYSKKLQKKSTVIPNPLDTSALPERFEGKRDKRIVAAGRFSDEKNFPMLIRAFARFREDFPDYILELCGEGALKGEFDALCSKLNIQESVLMPGFVSDLADRMVNAAMYVSTSNHEGISNSMLEALGMGVPTIVTDCPVGGSKMFVKTDENGILINMNDEDALVEAMIKIASDEGYAESISKNAVKIREELSAQKIAEKWIEIFEKVASK